MLGAFAASEARLVALIREIRLRKRKDDVGVRVEPSDMVTQQATMDLRHERRR